MQTHTVPLHTDAETQNSLTLAAQVSLLVHGRHIGEDIKGGYSSVCVHSCSVFSLPTLLSVSLCWALQGPFCCFSSPGVPEVYRSQMTTGWHWVTTRWETEATIISASSSIPLTLMRKLRVPSTLQQDNGAIFESVAARKRGKIGQYFLSRLFLFINKLARKHFGFLHFFSRFYIAAVFYHFNNCIM